MNVYNFFVRLAYLLLNPLTCQGIKDSFLSLFWQETICTHVLTQISENTDFRCMYFPTNNKVTKKVAYKGMHCILQRKTSFNLKTMAKKVEGSDVRKVKRERGNTKLILTRKQQNWSSKSASFVPMKLVDPLVLGRGSHYPRNRKIMS